MDEYGQVYEEVTRLAKSLEFKDLLKVRLLLKKSRILYKQAALGNQLLFARCAKKLDKAWKLLEEIKQSDKDDNF